MLIPIILSIISIVLIIGTSYYFYSETKELKNETSARFRELVEKINNANLYEYKFDKKQQESMKNLDDNIIITNELVRKMQNNLNYLERTKTCVDNACLTKSDILKLKSMK